MAGQEERFPRSYRNLGVLSRTFADLVFSDPEDQIEHDQLQESIAFSTDARIEQQVITNELLERFTTALERLALVSAFDAQILALILDFPRTSTEVPVEVENIKQLEADSRFAEVADQLDLDNVEVRKAYLRALLLIKKYLRQGPLVYSDYDDLQIANVDQT